MSNEKLEQVKRDIRGILISFKNDVSLEEFSKTFRGLIGTGIPTREFGYMSAVDFLYSIPNIVTVKVDRNGVYQLSVVADKSDEHVRKLVKKNNTKTNGRRNGYRTVSKSYQSSTLPVSTRRQVNSRLPNDTRQIFVPARLRAEVIQVVKQYPEGICFSSLILAYKTTFNKNLNLNWISNDAKDCFRKFVSVVGELIIKSVNDTEKIFCITSNNQNSNSNVKSPERSLEKESKENNEEFLQDTVEKPIRETVPKYIKTQIEKILTAYPGGVLAVDFPDIYEKYICEPLDFLDLGYCSLLELADDLPEFIAKGEEKDTGRWKLYHKQFIENIQTPFGHKNKMKILERETRAASRYTPFKAVDFVPVSHQFHQRELPEDAFSTFFYVEISAVINPGCFWFHLENTDDLLSNLELEMREFYSYHSPEYKLSDGDFIVGASCVAEFDGELFRTTIKSLPTATTATVSFVDYGTYERIPRSNLYHLKFEFMDLPAQAFKAELACIKPANLEPDWSTDANKRFTVLCQSSYLVAKIESVDFDEHSVILCDMSDGKDMYMYINDAMITEGFADEYHVDVLESADVSANDVSLTEVTECVTEKLYGMDLNSSLESCDIFVGNGDDMASPSALKSSSVCSGLNVKLHSPFEQITENGLDNSDYCNTSSSRPNQIVKKIEFGDGYDLHVINAWGEACVSAEDLANLFWNDTNADCLALRLRMKEVLVPTVRISIKEFEKLFDECLMDSVRGFDPTGVKNYVILYPLTYVMKVLNTFGHPSENVRKWIMKAIHAFKSGPQAYQNFEVNNRSEASFRPKQPCLYDLEILFENLRLKRSTLSDPQQKTISPDVAEMIESIENRIIGISSRMNEIKALCQKYRT